METKARREKKQNIVINRLMTAVVQEQDAEPAIRGLKKLDYTVTKLPSTGGFLGRRRATLLIGLEHGEEGKIVDALRKSCRTRVEYVTIPLEGTPLPLPAPTPITVGGATIFTFEIERYEVF
jgi:uncharacterized protein YaaQ